MAVATRSFRRDFSDYCEASLHWCAEQSLEATSKVALTLDYIVSNAERVANKSAATREALAEVRRKIGEFAGSKNPELTPLIAAMHKLAHDHRDVSELVSPLVEALQLQDFLQQYLQNLGRQIETWTQYRQSLDQYRQSLDGEGSCDATLKREFGQKLLANTVTVTEREIIRKHIMGLPEEASAVDTGLF